MVAGQRQPPFRSVAFQHGQSDDLFDAKAEWYKEAMDFIMRQGSHAMSILERWHKKSRSRLSLSLIGLTLIGLAFSCTQAATVLADLSRRRTLLESDVPDPAVGEVRQALIEMLEQKMKPGWTGTAFPLEELRRGDRLEIVDGTGRGERTWTFNCNLRERTFLVFRHPGAWL